MPAKMIFYDCETESEDHGSEQHHKIKLGWSCYATRSTGKGFIHKKYSYHLEGKAFCEYVQAHAYEKSTLYIFAHNVFFDLQASGFFYWFIKWGWKLNFWYDKGLMYILSIQKDKKKIVALSSTNYFSLSLSEIGKLLGMDKGEVDFATASEDELADYCRNDLEILIKAMENYFSFLEVHDLGRFGMTKASQALYAYRHRFMEKKIFIHREENIISFERSAYFGGRVECFYVGDLSGPLYASLDINSMYPFIMKNYPVPVMLIEYVEECTLGELEKLVQDYCVVAEVTITTDRAAYPKVFNNKLVFGTGTFQTSLCTEGVKYALAHGHIDRVHKVAVYEKDFIFSEYVDYFYALKVKYEKEKNPIYREISKYLMNCLYGKFAQKRDIIEEIGSQDTFGYSRTETIDLVTGKPWTVTHLFDKMYAVIGERSAGHSFVAISAHITEYGRFIMMKLIDSVGRDSIYYCDTDSIKLKASDVEKIDYPISDVELGALKIEKRFRKFYLFGLKDYIAGPDIKIKGVPSRSVKTGPASWTYEQFQGQKTHLHRQVTKYYIVSQVVKTNKRLYDKGLIDSTGKVLPFSFGSLLTPSGLHHNEPEDH